MSPEISSIIFSIPIQHFFDVIDFFVHPSRRKIHPTQKFACHRQHDGNSAQVSALVGLVSHHPQDFQETHAWLRMTLYLELVARIVMSSSMFWLFFICCLRSLFYPCRCLSFCARRVVSRLRQVRPHVDPHLLLCPGCERHIPCTSFGLGDAIFIHPCRTRQGSLDNCSHSFSTSIVVWFRRSSVRCQRCTTQTTSNVTVSLGVCRRHVECSWLNPLEFFQLQSLAMAVQLLLCQM